jgi:hypothetical protein
LGFWLFRFIFPQTTKFVDSVLSERLWLLKVEGIKNSNKEFLPIWTDFNR